ncbi:MAG: hypothetical protein PHQ93_01725 [Sulfurimonas sp.]|uniref:hypothetical protein n=1 Tax=Sulfurimonas sp. TaxID=2022749 RepID=UPI002637160D|nr:hypothetical protein [Sulfurimonas sp.]MDD5399894.1 hypothetical protein [Sulfurimonas sp.]
MEEERERDCRAALAMTRKRERLPHKRADCFTTFAMTRWEEMTRWLQQHSKINRV